MRIAISTDEGVISGHFGRCPSFTLVDVDNNKVVEKQTIANPGHHPGYLPEFLRGQGVNCIMAGGMGNRARALFGEHGIEVIVGVTGPIDEVIDRFVCGQLEGGANTCVPESGKGYGLDKTFCDHNEKGH